MLQKKLNYDKRSDLTLLVDGNWLLMSRLAIQSRIHHDFDSLISSLKESLLTSILHVLSVFHNIDNIIFCADGGSWRKEIPVPDYITEAYKSEDKPLDYKGNRQRSDTFDWDRLFEEFNSFITQMTQFGINTCQEHNIEGDDWIMKWSVCLNNDGTNVIIWSKDRDLEQLVSKHPETGAFTVLWNKDYGLVSNEELNSSNDDFNLLFNAYADKNDTIYRELVDSAGGPNAVKTINTNEIIINKIINGDATDNVYPICERISNNRHYKITSNYLQLASNIDVYNENDYKKYFNDVICSDKLKATVGKSFLFSSYTGLTPEQQFVDHFELNRKLVKLDEREYPTEIISMMNKYDSYKLSKEIKPILEEVQAEKHGMTDILDII